MNRIGESASASKTCMFSSPGRPNTQPTPSFSRQCTKSSAARMVACLVTGNSDFESSAPFLAATLGTGTVSWNPPLAQVLVSELPPLRVAQGHDPHPKAEGDSSGVRPTQHQARSLRKRPNLPADSNFRSLVF